MTPHKPRLYRYEVSTVVRRRTPRAVANRYGRAVIGLAAIVGRYAYCVKWAHA